MESILQQFYKDINLSNSKYLVDLNSVLLQQSDYKDQKWDNPIINKMMSNYEKGRSLFEFCYNVSICNSNKLKLQPPNFDIVIPINTISFFEEVNALWFCYSTTLNIMVLCFTSTYTNSLFLVDVNYLHLDLTNINNSCDGFKIHGGFLTFYKGFRDKIIELVKKYYNNETQLFITGFSLGGAISTLSALDLHKVEINTTTTINNITHFSFASPRIFNTIGANHFEFLSISSYRVHNNSDIVISLPFPIMISSTRSLEIQDFMHIGKSISFNDNIGNYYDNHILSYLKYFMLI